MDSQSSVPIPAPAKTKDPQAASPISKLKSFLMQHKLIAGIGGLIALCLIALIIYILQSKSPGTAKNIGTAKVNDAAAPAVVPVPENAIAKVGDEFIFKSDLEFELANYQGQKDDNAKKILTDKLIRDSIALQAAKKANLINLNLDTEVFNADNKNYGKRISDIKNIQTKINTGVDQISGILVSVWFYNYKPAKIGLEEGKKEAFKRISELHSRVVNKEITIEEAGNIIKNDPSYDQLDFGYQNNALFNFSYEKGKKITQNPEYDAILWNTKPGDVTDVFLGKNVNEFTSELGDAYYVFGQVKGKSDKGITQTYDQWLEAQKSNYEVTYY